MRGVKYFRSQKFRSCYPTNQRNQWIDNPTRKGRTDARTLARLAASTTSATFICGVGFTCVL